MAKTVKPKGGKQKVAMVIVLFARKHSFVIHPYLGCEYFVKNWLLLGACACAPERKHCPCPESITEVLELGKCKCGLYWKSLDCWLRYDPTQPDKNIIEEVDSGNQHN